MFSIFEFISYREYLLGWIKAQGDHSYGLKGRMAQAMGVSSSLLSQILKGEKTLTPDQTSDLAEYLGLIETETDYLHLLVESDRAGNPRYQEKLKKKITHAQEQSRRIGKRIPRQKELSDEQKAIFYSSWLYTGVFNLTAIPGKDHADAIAGHLHLEPGIVHRVLRFLIQNGMCVEHDGKITFGPASTHVDSDSPFVNKHHQNWRFQAIQHMDHRREQDLYFTSPMSLSREAAEEIRRMLPTFIQNVIKISSPSPSEIVMCLNLDWFAY